VKVPPLDPCARQLDNGPQAGVQATQGCGTSGVHSASTEGYTGGAVREIDAACAHGATANAECTVCCERVFTLGWHLGLPGLLPCRAAVPCPGKPCTVAQTCCAPGLVACTHSSLHLAILWSLQATYMVAAMVVKIWGACLDTRCVARTASTGRFRACNGVVRAYKVSPY
jgi:hypothetical protein